MSKIFNLILLISILTISQLNLNAQNINLTFPNGGEHWINNTESPHNIIWESSSVSNVKIEYSTDNGVSWETITDNTANENYYTWAVPNIVSDQVLIKVSDSNDPNITDQSENTFLISDQNIYYAKWETSMGNFRAKLHGDKVPITVQNFINLAERNFYDNLIFHRVISNFMIQDGCPLGTGTGGPGYAFDNEIHPDLSHSSAGVLAMANAGPNTNGSQYYITVKATTWLDGSYNIFGQIVDGLNIVYEISEVPTNNDAPITEVNIHSISIEEYNPQLTLTAPSNNSELIAENDFYIRWESDFIENVKIEFSSDGGTTRTVIADNIPAWHEEYKWTVPKELSDDCYIYITDLSNPALTSSNTQAFSIKKNPAKVIRLNFLEDITAPDDNPANLIGPGRKVHFKALVENNLTQSMDALSVDVTSECPDVQITTGTATVPSTTAGSTEWTETCFEIMMPQDISSIKNLKLKFSVADANIDDTPWETKFNIPLPAKLNYTYVDDDNNGNSSGNSNITIEPNEIIEFSPNITNSGDSTLYNVSARLTSPNSFISVWNNVEGVDGMVYDSLTYNNSEPITPDMYSAKLDGVFVFDYTENETYYTDLILEVYAFVNEPQGSHIGFAIPYSFNTNFPVGIKNLQSDNSAINIYPNPSSRFVFLSCNEALKARTIQISDISGKTIKECVMPQNGKLQLNVSDFNAGIYFVSLKTDKQLSVSKLIIK